MSHEGLFRNGVTRAEQSFFIECMSSVVLQFCKIGYYSGIVKRERRILKAGDAMDMEELIWKLIDITDIKKEYLLELNELLDTEMEVLSAFMEKDAGAMSDFTALSFKETQEAMHKIQRMLMNLDEEFLDCMNQLKEEGDVISVAELDGHRYTRLRDLQKIVEGVIHIESLYDIKRKEVHELKSKWMARCRQSGQSSHISAHGNGRAVDSYRKAQTKTL